MGSHIVSILFLEWTMLCSFDSIVTRVGDVGAGIMGEVFSGGEEGPGSLARHLRVGIRSHLEQHLPFTGKSTCQGLPCKISVSGMKIGGNRTCGKSFGMQHSECKNGLL